MADPRFFTRAGPFKLGRLAGEIGAGPIPAGFGDRMIVDVSPIETAGRADLTYCSDKRFAAGLRQSEAAACLVRAEMAGAVPPETIAVIADNPARAYAKAAQLFYPRMPVSAGIDETARVDATAKLGKGIQIGPYAVVGAHAEIGQGTVIGAHSVIGAGTAIGSLCIIGPGVSIACSLIGDRVIIHAGARLGQDGFGFVPGPEGYLKIPQLGRVIVQDDVEIGAGTAIDRGSGSDTMIGQGTKIDNLVQIGHNVRIGRNCVIAGQVGISGSTVLGDFVALGGKVGLSDHITVGAGGQVAALSGVMWDVPPGAKHMGIPARPIKEFMREFATLKRLARKSKVHDD
jgi:UDP-3-O-[3-hydroxymyristoyl] glucosamine N-acyltransferase